MSTNVSSVVSHFPDTENGFTTTTAGSVSSGAATVTLNSVAGYTNGEPVVLVIDPTDSSKKQTFTGIIDTAGVQITSVVWTAGTNQAHALGATVVDYATATHIAMMSKGIKVNHTQKGNHKTLTDDNANEWIGLTTTGSAVNYLDVANSATGTNPILSAKGDDSNVGLTLTPKGTGAVKATLNYDAWVSGLTAPSTITALGNRSYTLLISSTDYTDRLSAGMRLKTTRTVAAPTQCTDLESGSSQYYSKASPNKMTFTDDWTAMAWIKLESYTGSRQIIINRSDYSTQGFGMAIDSSGRLEAASFRIAANNSVTTSYQSIPLGKWVHVAVTSDLSGTSVLTYIDGVLVPSLTTITGTITALVQYTGDLRIGALSSAASQYFDGKIAQVAVFNTAVLSAATILSYMSQGLSGSETNLLSAYSFNNSIADLNTTTPNDLTAQGSAVATNADSPFGGQAEGLISSTLDYAEIVSVVFSTNTTITVRVPDVNTIPTSGGITALSYSTQFNPLGWPGISNVLLEVILGSSFSTSSASATQVLGLTCPVTVPTGRKIRATVSTNAISQAAIAANVISIWDGTVGSGTQLVQGNLNTSGTATPTASAMTVITPTLTPSTASKTYNVGLSASAGTVTFNATAATAQAFFRVELAH